MASKYPLLPEQPEHRGIVDIAVERASHQAYANTLDEGDASQARQANVVGRQLGLPGATVGADLSGFQREQEAQQNMSLLGSDPRLARFVADPHNAAAVKDDLPALSDMSAILKFADDKTDPTGRNFTNQMKQKLGQSTSLAAFSPNEPVWHRALGPIVPDRGPGFSAAPDQQPIDPTPGNVLRGLGAGIVGGTAEGLLGAIHSAADNLGLGDKLTSTDWYRRQAFEAQQANDAQNLNYPSLGKVAGIDINPGRWAFSAATSLGQLGVSLLSGNPVAAFGVVAGGQEYQTLRNRGASAKEATAASLLYGGIESGTEAIELNWMLGKFGKKASGKFLGGLLLREVPGELAATTGENFIDAMTTGGVGWEQYKKNLPQDLVDTAASTALVTGGVTVAHGLRQHLSREANDMDEVERAAAGGAFVDNLMAAAENSKVRKEDPDTLHAFIAQRTEDSVVRNLYLPLEDAVTYMQSEKYDGSLDRYADQIAQAQPTQGDIVIPVADAVAHLSGTQAWEALKDSIRVEPGGLSRKEASAKQEEIMATLEQRGKEIAQGVADDTEANAPAAEVYTEVKNRLRIAGIDDRQAEAISQLYAARYEARATRRGGTAMDQFKAAKISFPSEQKGQPAGRQVAQATVNIGLNVNDGSKVNVEDALKALRDQGVDVTESQIRQSETEPTLIARLSKPLTKKQANAVSKALKQDAIAQRVGDKGALHGPAAEKWGPFNPDYFLDFEHNTPQQRTPVQDVMPEAGWTPERIDGLIDSAERSDGASQAVAVMMTPDEYLGLMANAKGRKIIEERVTTLAEYGDGLDLDVLRASSPIMMTVRAGSKPSAWQVERGVAPPDMVHGHSGRHRMTMLKLAGIQSVPVVVVLQESDGKPKFVKDLTDIPSFLGNRSRSDQTANGDRTGSITGGVPISGKFRDQLIDMGGRTLFQNETPEAIFYSAAERAVENSPQQKASAQQWKALLTPGKTPGIKSEEIEWTGIHEWLDMQKGQIDKDALIHVLRDRAIKVEEVVLGNENWTYQDLGYEIELDEAGDEWVLSRDGEEVERFRTLEQAERYARTETFEEANRGQFQQWSSDPSNPTYRELLITLPQGVGSNPQRSPSTHWDTEGVVAHVRFMEKQDATSSRVLFIEEVQSDWHQKGRDQGYANVAPPQEIAAAQAEFDVKQKEYVEARRNLIARAEALGLMPPHPEMSDEQKEGTAASKIHGFVQASASEGDAAEELYKHYRRTQLAKSEARQFLENLKGGKGIPEAPFKSSWPALVMKRAIRWAVDNGYDKVAWTTGEEQAQRYNLSQHVGSVNILSEGDGTYSLQFSDRNADRIRHEQIGSGPYTPEKLTELLGRDVAKNAIEIADREAAGYEAKGQKVDWVVVPADSLRVGGEGMKAFYDRNLVNITNDIIKKYGVKVGQVGVTPMDPKRRAALLDKMRQIGGLSTYGIGSRAEAEERIETYKHNIAEGIGDTNKAGEWIAELQAALPIIDELERNDKMGDPHPGFEINDKLREAATAGFTLFQRDDNARGATTFTDDGQRLIQLFGNADRSTLLHETGHIWLEELKADATADDAADQDKKDWDTVKKWFAANGAPLPKGDFISTPAHELWARGVERYVMEGKAPTIGLQGVFKTFSAWLLRIYQVVQNLNSPITPEVRDVMARLLATQDAIDEARRNNDTEPLFKSAEEAGMSEAEFADYQQRVANARDEAYDALLFKMMEKIRRERTKEMRDRKSAIRSEVMQQINEQPQFKLLHLLRTGRWLGDPERAPVKVKLNTGWLIDNYGEGILDKLPRGIQIFAGNGESGDVIAEMVGMASGSEVVHALVGMRAASDALRAQGETRSMRDRMVSDQTDKIMADRYGDTMTDGSIEEEAIAALNTAAQGEIIGSEIRQLAKRKNVLGVPTPYQFAREWAKRTVASGHVRDVASRSALQRYTRAANKAARLAEAAILKGDIDEAYRQKQAQLLNHALLAEAKAAADRIDKIVARMKKLAGRAAMKSVHPDYLDRVHMLLENYDFRPRSQRSIDEQKDFEKWLEGQRAQGFEVHIPPRLENRGEPYTRVSVQELESLGDLVDSLIAVGRTKQKIKTAQEERDFNEFRDEVVSRLEQLPDRKMTSRRLKDGLKKTTNAPINERASIGSRIASDFVKVEKLAEEMDGGSTGPFNDLLTIGSRDAENKRHDLRHKVLNPIAQLYHALGRKHWSRMQERVTIPELTWNTLNAGDPRLGTQVTITRSELLAIFMNMGNLSNLEKLSKGERWPVETLRNVMLRELTKEDYDLAQKLWDQVGALWPDIVATERELSGVVPEKVVNAPISTPFGEYEGGYWPVVYDANRWQVAEDMEGKQLDDMFGIKSGVATQKGHTITRTGAFGPINLSLERVLFNHIEQVITRVAYAPFARDVLRVIRNSTIRGMIDTKLGAEYRKQIEPWLQQQINAGLVNSKAARWWERVLRQFRINTQIAAMGFRHTVLLAQSEGLLASADRIGARWVATGLKTYALHPIDTVKFVLESSAEMRYRNEAVTRETAEMSTRMRGKHSWFTTLQNFALAPIGWADRYTVSVPTWMGAYKKAVSEGMNDEEAIAFADKNVRMSQGAGTAKDLSAVQARLGEGSRFFTMFYSPFNVMFNQQWAGVRAAKRGNPVPLLKTTFYWVVLTSLADAMLHGDWPKDWGDAEGIEEWFARNVFFGLWAGIPVARDLATWGNQTMGGQYAGDPGSTPVSRTLTAITKAVTDAVKWEKTGEAPKHPIKEAANTTATVGGVPISQAGSSAQFLWDVHEGKQDPQSVSDWYFGITHGTVPKRSEDEANR